jgi:hypothetical protein
MKKTTKILLAIASVLPFLYLIIFFVVMLSAFPLGRFDSRADIGTFENIFKIILPLHILAMLLITGLTIFYMVNVFRNDRVHKDKKALWAVVLFLGNVIAFPVYWYYYIWPEGNDTFAASNVRGALGDADAFNSVNDATKEGRREYAPPPQPPDWR